MSNDAIIYLDNHATTRVDPRVIEVMLPTFDPMYANAGSVTHRPGQAARDLVESARTTVANILGARSESEVVFTSGATESNNLAIRGYCQKIGAGHIITVQSEHQAVLSPVHRLEQAGFSVTRLAIQSNSSDRPGLLDLEQLASAIRPETIMVSVMLANNEIGAIQPIIEISRICHEQNIALHCDATQAVGKMPVDVEDLGVDLLSFSGHKIHGPKGIGGLYIRSRGRRIRLTSQIDGGGQENGRRGGTLNVTGIVGLARAMELCQENMDLETSRIRGLRDRLFEILASEIEGLTLNGPRLEQVDLRLCNNLNCQFPGLDGHSLMVGTERLAISSGSACTATSSEPSHVLTALGLDRDQVRSSLRFGLSRFTTDEEITTAANWLIESAKRIRKLGGAAVGMER